MWNFSCIVTYSRGQPWVLSIPDIVTWRQSHQLQSLWGWWAGGSLETNFLAPFWVKVAFKTEYQLSNYKKTWINWKSLGLLSDTLILHLLSCTGEVCAPLRLEVAQGHKMRAGPWNMSHVAVSPLSRASRAEHGQQTFFLLCHNIQHCWLLPGR